MKKILLSSLMLIAFVLSASAQLVPNTDLTIKDVRKGTTAFALVSQDGNAFYGPDAQNLGFGNYSAAFATSNVWTTFKLESLAGNPYATGDVEDGFLIHAYNAAGEAYSIWGSPGYLNSQPATGNCCFILGLKDEQLGQDIQNGAVWYIEAGDNGYSFQNAGTGLYLNGNAAANSATPVYYKFKSLSDHVTALLALIGEAKQYEESSEAVRNAVIHGVDIWDTPSATYEDYLDAMDRLNSSVAEATAIKTVNADASSAESYNIAGQRVNASYKGVVVKNGKKYIIK